MNRKFMRHGLNGLLVLFSSLTVAASPDPYAETIESAHLLGELALKDQVFHVQGLEIDATRIWATSVDQANCRGYLHEFDRASGRMLRHCFNQDTLTEELRDRYREHTVDFVMAGILAPGHSPG